LPAGTVDVVRRALEEDLAHGPDVTTLATIPADAVSVAHVVTRGPGVVAGLQVAETVFAHASDGRLRCVPLVRDGDRVAPGDVLMTVEGPTAALLTAERTALNFLTMLSGVATLTRSVVDAVEHTGVQVRDSRKTLPGLRTLQKYAVRCGGGTNHRMGLGDEALLKDNHIAAAGSLTAALHAVRALAPDVPVEVECDTLDQVAEAIGAGATLILLDNMSLDQVRAAVGLADGRVRLEVSGKLDLASAHAAAETGVDYLALGALTHSAPALDIGLDLSSAS
ncbi:MAG TPA: carboxylating nicotinate-nucleotide diphosphorylase, partial [Marmoricola sp.]|nr:carboxylating nicotinate-nucleotide diphosphorylase [Marmoricola sp.]